MARLVTILGFVCLFAGGMHAATFTVTTTADGGAGSLRQAILDANANGNVVIDAIEFDIAAAGVQTIALAGPLPNVTTPVFIDGYTQTGASANTLAFISGNNAVILISVDGGGNAFGCLQLDPGASGSTVRGLNVQRCTTGIALDGTTDARVYGNFIGTDATGTIARPNSIGVLLTGAATGNSVGETSAAERNVISANNAGVYLQEDTDSNAVESNYIGTDVTGTSALGAGAIGVWVEGLGNVIRSNLISGLTLSADSAGVLLTNDATDTDVTANRIGTQRTGGGSIPNTYGILVTASTNAPFASGIGYFSSGTANVIANSLADGIAIRASTPPSINNYILYNTYRNNAGLAIDLNDDGPTPNDPLDADTGANTLQNSPVITSAVRSPGGAVQVNGTLHTTPNGPFVIQLYFAATCGPSGAAQGSFVQETAVTTDALGNAAFSFTVPSLPANGRVSALAHNAGDGNTSELSECFAVVQESAQLEIDDRTVAEGDGGTSVVTFTVTLTPASELPVTVTAAAVPGTATTPSDFTAAPAVLTFAPGQTTRTYSVTINGDTTPEPDETFTVQLSAPGGAVIADGEGTGTITNDDAPAAAPVAVPFLNNAGLVLVTLLLAALALRRL
ncbi:MAG TPA: Calx-beta domain-containing protein [Thermoanaerobaculia bacterium]